MNEKNKQKIIQAGKIASEIKKFAREIIKPEVSLLEIAEKIEAKIEELGGKPAFPVNLSINDIAAHYTPSHDDETRASGLLKIDIGVHVDGWIADTAFSIDLENNEENKKLIEASKKAVDSAIKLIKQKSGNITTGEIGKIIQETIESQKFIPIINLSGHSIEQYRVHAGLTIPNIDNSSNDLLNKGIFAIERYSG